MVPRKLDAKKRSLTTGWSGPYKLIRLYENGSARLKDLKGLELPKRVNRGKLKKYHLRTPEEDQ